MKSFFFTYFTGNSSVFQRPQTVSYCYNETVVPKKHYKNLLTKQLEEVVADSVTVNMVNAYYKTLAEFNKGNREWFVLAVLCIELNIKPDKASAQELSTLQTIAANINAKQAPLLNPDIKKAFEGAIKN